MAPVLTALLLSLCACGSVGRAAPAANPSPTPLSAADLQYRLIDKVGTPTHCNPQGPILGTQDRTGASQMVTALRTQNPAEFDAIVHHEHLNPASLSPADDQRVLAQASLLAAVPLTPQGPAAYGFSYELAGPPAMEVTGTISSTGTISVASRSPGPQHLCPL